MMIVVVMKRVIVVVMVVAGSNHGDSDMVVRARLEVVKEEEVQTGGVSL